MFHQSLLMLHVFSAVIALLSGFMAMFLRKGSGAHGAAGTVFFGSMLGMTISALYISIFIRWIPGNIAGGSLTLYLVVTAWRAGRVRDGSVGVVDRIAPAFAALVALGTLTLGVQAALAVKPQVPPAVLFVFAFAATLCGIGDVRLLLRGGVTGARRIVRHLVRMSLSLLIATLSFYPGQFRLFPKWLRETNLLFIPHVLLVGALLFYLARYTRLRRVQREMARVAVPRGETLAGSV